MKLFIDTANVVEIKDAVRRGFLKGITTNPTLIARERRDQLSLIREIVTWGRHPHPELSISVEPSSDEMIKRFLDVDRSLVIKVPISWDGLELVKNLREDKIRTNVTACMSFNQAIMAANAGADYVSLFWNRIKDGGEQPGPVVYDLRKVFRDSGCKTEIIVGSIRQPEDVWAAFQTGAHIVTVPPNILKEMCKHPKTDEVVAQFTRDARSLPATTLPNPSEGIKTGRPVDGIGR